MNEDIKQRWVAALRSGEFEQGRDHLCEGGKYCCLGVLSELAVRDGVIAPAQEATSPSGDPISGLAYDGNRHHLPESVARWAGLTEEWEGWDGEIHTDYLSNPAVDGDALADLNDEGVTFAELADLIEEKL